MINIWDEKNGFSVIFCTLSNSDKWTPLAASPNLGERKISIMAMKGIIRVRRKFALVICGVIVAVFIFLYFLINNSVPSDKEVNKLQHVNLSFSPLKLCNSYNLTIPSNFPMNQSSRRSASDRLKTNCVNWNLDWTSINTKLAKLRNRLTQLNRMSVTRGV